MACEATIVSYFQVVLTGILLMCILAIVDKNNSPAPEGTQALLIGILVVVLGVSLGMNTGYAINPARDLPPRFFTFIAGWGKEVFRCLLNSLGFQQAGGRLYGQNPRKPLITLTLEGP